MLGPSRPGPTGWWLSPLVFLKGVSPEQVGSHKWGALAGPTGPA